MKKIFYVYTLVFLQVYLFSFPVFAEKSEKEMFFDNVANNWDKSSASAEELSRINEVIGYLGLREGETVLDAGCGTGRLIPFLHNKVGKNGHVYGIDFSQEMLRIAKQKHHSENISFVKADITQIPLPSESIDRIICFCTFPHIDNKMLTLREFYRLLKPDGVLIICNLMSSKELNELHRKIGGAIANDVSPDIREMKQLFF